MVNKRGSHVGMMLSFAIFVTFIVFLYSITRPAINLGEDKNSILNYVESGIIQNTSANLTVANVQLNIVKASKNCVKLNLFFTILQDIMPISIMGATVVVKNGLEEKQPSYNNVIANPVDTNLRINRDGTSGIVSSVSVTNQGSGYSSRYPPRVSFSGGGGSGAVAKASVSSDGKITSVIVTKGGRGYTSAPSVSFNTGGRGGSGAAATATIKSNSFFKVYYSPSFTKLTDGTSDCVSLSNTGTNPDYSLASITIDKYIFEKNVVNLVSDYNANYENLKEELKIPAGNEFWFKFTKGDGTSISPTEPEEPSTNVFSNDIPIQYVDSDASIQSGFINIRVW